MQANFDACLGYVLKHEGGYVDHPADPGGATNKGITRRTLAAWRGIAPYTDLPKSEVRNISDREVAAIYKANYWDKLRGDDLPSGVDYAVFDFGVNSGPSRAASYLQEIVGSAPDGMIGPLTLEAVKEYCDHFGSDTLVTELCADRMAFLQRLSTWKTFGRGWTSRVDGVRSKAMQMARLDDEPMRQPDDPGVSPPDTKPSKPLGWSAWGAVAAVFSALLLKLFGVY